MQRAARASALARDLRRGAGRRASRSRATSTSCSATDDGLVVVDYKTDAVDPATRADRIAHYRVQGAAYAIAVAAATGERVDRCVFVFLDPAGASEVEIAGDELAAAVAEVRALLVAVRDDPSAPPPLVPSDA